MPSINIEGPAIQAVEVKRILVKEITNAVEKAYKLPREVFTIVIKENKPKNVEVGGKLILDVHKE